MNDRLLKIATVSAPHGIRGEVRLKTFLEDQDMFENLGPYFDIAGKDLGEVIIRGQTKGQLIARISGAKYRDEAEALRGLNLYIPREKLPALEEEDEFYYEDLVGLKVMEDGKEIGIVKALRDHGAGDLIEILNTENKVELFSFSLENFPEISLDQGHLTFVRPTEILSQDEDGQVH